MTVVSLATSEEVAADGGPARMVTVVLASSAPNVAVGVMAPAWLNATRSTVKDPSGPVKANSGSNPLPEGTARNTWRPASGLPSSSRTVTVSWSLPPGATVAEPAAERHGQHEFLC